VTSQGWKARCIYAATRDLDGATPTFRNCASSGYRLLYVNAQCIVCRHHENSMASMSTANYKGFILPKPNSKMAHHQPEVVFLLRFSRRRRDFSTDTDCLVVADSDTAVSGRFPTSDRQPKVIFFLLFSRRRWHFSTKTECREVAELESTTSGRNQS
jgi:hypothetical protein